MLLSIALILLVGKATASLCKKVKLPSLIGMLLTGIILGPHILGILDQSILNISAEIRKIALIIILTRAGLGLDLSVLKKIGRPALLMCFVPATFEMLAVAFLGQKILGLSLLEAALLGAVLAAVSPAVVVPRMVKLIDEGYGKSKGVPQLVLAGASVDDVYVIVLFTTFLGMMQGKEASLISLVNIPISILLGILLGLIVAYILYYFFKKFSVRDTVKVLIVLSVSMLLVVFEENLSSAITFAALISIMFVGIGIKQKDQDLSERLSSKYSKLWVAAEIFLFVLVGASLNISYISKVGIPALVLIILALLFRMLGVYLSLLGTKLNKNERIFTMLAYTPKATVQAAIGGLPLVAGLAVGDTVLTVAVLAIVLTAPLGAFAIDLSYKKLLSQK